MKQKIKKKIKKKKNEKEIEDLKNEKTRLNKKIACLHLLIDDKKEVVKDLELQKCKILEEKIKNEKKISYQKKIEKYEILKIKLIIYFRK